MSAAEIKNKVLATEKLLQKNIKDEYLGESELTRQHVHAYYEKSKDQNQEFVQYSKLDLTGIIEARNKISKRIKRKTSETSRRKKLRK